jgi:hypothetical protein
LLEEQDMMIPNDRALIPCDASHTTSSMPTALQSVRPLGRSIAFLSHLNIGLW